MDGAKDASGLSRDEVGHVFFKYGPDGEILEGGETEFRDLRDDGVEGEDDGDGDEKCPAAVFDHGAGDQSGQVVEPG